MIVRPGTLYGTDEDLEDLFEIDLSVLAELERGRAGKHVDEEIKELVLVDFIVRLRRLFGHTFRNGRLN